MDRRDQRTGDPIAERPAFVGVGHSMKLASVEATFKMPRRRRGGTRRFLTGRRSARQVEIFLDSWSVSDNTGRDRPFSSLTRLGPRPITEWGSVHGDDGLRSGVEGRLTSPSRPVFVFDHLSPFLLPDPRRFPTVRFPPRT
jgi:hypothetical protein